MPALKRRPIFKAPLRGASTDGVIETGFPEGDLSFSVRSTRFNIDNYFFKVFTKRLIPLPSDELGVGCVRLPRRRRPILNATMSSLYARRYTSSMISAADRW